jgi:hypothetical protein
MYHILFSRGWSYVGQLVQVDEGWMDFLETRMCEKDSDKETQEDKEI